MTQNVEENTVLSVALPELFLGWIPASAGTTRYDVPIIQIWQTCNKSSKIEAI
jgi:hypothetical protein